MKVVSSIGNLKNRSKDCQIVRRRGRFYVISKTDPRLKVCQGYTPQKSFVGLKTVFAKNSGINYEQNLTQEEIFQERLLMGLRLVSGINLSQEEQNLLNQRELIQLIAQNMILLENDRLQVTKAGRLLLNKIIGLLLG